MWNIKDFTIWSFKCTAHKYSTLDYNLFPTEVCVNNSETILCVVWDRENKYILDNDSQMSFLFVIESSYNT